MSATHGGRRSPTPVCAYVRRGSVCSSTGDAAHCEQYVHLCVDGVGCALLAQSDDFPNDVKAAQHVREFVHPCLDLFCADKSPQHLFNFTHMCEANDQCTDFSDGLHLQLCEHDCPHGDKCTAADKMDDAAMTAAAAINDGDGMDMRLHLQVYRHRCQGGQKHCTQSAVHRLRCAHYHARDLTATERLALINPLTQWRKAPHHPVRVRYPDGTSKMGTLRGWQCDDSMALNRTKSMVVDLSDGTGSVLVPENDLEGAAPQPPAVAAAAAVLSAAGAADAAPPASMPPTEAPWIDVRKRKQVRLLKLSDAQQQVMDGLMNTTVASLQVTFEQMFTILRTKYDIAVFLIGGAVRDVIMGKTAIHDMDCAFNCGAKELKEAVDKEGWKSSPVNAGGLIRVGNSWASMFFEGKCLSSINSDCVPLSQPLCTDITTGRKCTVV